MIVGREALALEVTFLEMRGSCDLSGLFAHLERLLGRALAPFQRCFCVQNSRVQIILESDISMYYNTFLALCGVQNGASVPL